MKDKKYLEKSLDELSIKEALTVDAGEIGLRTHVMIEPAPMPFIPITPFVIGKKVFKCVKKATASIRKSID